jgi:hypothetical protein
MYLYAVVIEIIVTVLQNGITVFNLCSIIGFFKVLTDTESHFVIPIPVKHTDKV